MKKAKLSDYYTEEEKVKKLALIWIDEAFNRAFDDGVNEIEVTSPEFRMLHLYASSNGLVFIGESGSYVLGVKLIRV